eukprot:GDKJ01014451.1.p1 GENE.GDKJ01014451.1~~GDKJ01014451.1.p1  ORF type:complete len:860 (+),score=235.72 GDKJ01014451.1:14-2593(+)
MMSLPHVDVKWFVTSEEPSKLPLSYGFSKYYVNRWTAQIHKAAELYQQNNVADAERLYLSITDELLKFSSEGLELKVALTRQHPVPNFQEQSICASIFGNSCVNNESDDATELKFDESSSIKYTIDDLSEVPEFATAFKAISALLVEPIVNEIANGIAHKNTILNSAPSDFDAVVGALTQTQDLHVDIQASNSPIKNRQSVSVSAANLADPLSANLTKSEAQTISRMTTRRRSFNNGSSNIVPEITSTPSKKKLMNVSGTKFRNVVFKGDGTMAMKDIESLNKLFDDANIIFEEVAILVSEEKIMTAIKLWSALEAIIFRACESLSTRSVSDPDADPVMDGLKKQATSSQKPPQNASSFSSPKAETFEEKDDALLASDAILSLHSVWSKSQLIVDLLIKKEVADKGIALLREQTTAELGWSVTKHAHHYSFMKVQPNNQMIFRCEGAVDEPIFNIMAILNESDLHHKWVPYASKTELTHQVSRVTQIGFHEYSLPWPLTNRATYTYAFGIDMMDEEEECVLVVAHGIPQALSSFLEYKLPAYKAVQMKLEAFAFTLTPGETPNRSYITFIASLDPQIDIMPQFIMNASMKLLTNGMFTNILQQAANFSKTEYPNRIKTKRNVYAFLEERLHTLRNVEGRTFQNTPAALAFKKREMEAQDPKNKITESPSLKTVNREGSFPGSVTPRLPSDSPAFRRALHVVETIESKAHLNTDDKHDEEDSDEEVKDTKTSPNDKKVSTNANATPADKTEKSESKKTPPQNQMQPASVPAVQLQTLPDMHSAPDSTSPQKPSKEATSAIVVKDEKTITAEAIKTEVARLPSKGSLSVSPPPPTAVDINKKKERTEEQKTRSGCFGCHGK